LSFILSPALHAQEETPIQLHGIVVSNDSLKQLLPNVQILGQESRTGKYF